MLPHHISFSAAIYFWRIYQLEKGKDRDKELEEVYPYILLSNFIFLLSIFLNIGILWNFIYDTSGLVVLGFLTILFFSVHSYFQTIICKIAILRNENQLITKEELMEFGKFVASSTVAGFKLLSSVATLKLIEELEDIFEEFQTHDQDTNFDDNNYQKNNYQHEKPNSSSETLESILNKYDIPLKADESYITKRFRSLAKEYHPDSPTGDAEMFKELWTDKQRFIKILKSNQAA